MIVAFTGTKLGMTDAQQIRVREILLELNPSEIHLGDCVGADEHARVIATELAIKTIGHPPTKTKYQAFGKFDFSHQPGDYLTRDRAMVNASDLLIGTPKGFSEQIRSGTWYTIRYARKKNKRVIIVFPDGSDQRSTTAIEQAFNC